MKRSDDVEDKQIVELYWKRSEQAISETSKKYGTYCYAISHNILQNKEDADECVNDTYIRAWNSIPPHKPNNLKTYLAKITRNLSLSKYEKNTAKKRNNGQVPLLLDELAECLPSEYESETVITDNIVIKSSIEYFLGTLSKKNRQIFIKRYWYMNSLEDIAKEYNMSENNVSVILFRMRKDLKRILQKEGVIHE